MTQAVNAGGPPKCKEAALAELLQSTGYEITNENGQRKYGPPKDWDVAPPPKGSEVFVGKLPRDVYEDELVPIFERVGKIHEMRLMMDYGNNNRGFAFIMYTCPDHAKGAIEELDNFEIRKGRYIGVCKSVDNCRLFVGGIPKTKTKDEIMEEMKKITDAVCNVILYSSIADKTKNRGFAFVEYESHKAAAMARRKLLPGKISLWGHDIAVDWAEPEPEVDEETMSKVTILYVRNLMMSTTEDKLKEIFSLGDKLKIDKVKKLRDFAFVHYRNREDAENALNRLNNTDIDGSIVEVTWAKPVDRVTRQRNQNKPNQPVSTIIYPPGFDLFAGAYHFTNCPGRNNLQRIPFRGRGRGAAGIRRFRNYPQNPSHSGSFKPPEGGNASHSPHYPQYQPNKLGRIPEEGKQYASEYMYLPVGPGAEGIEPTMAFHGPPLLPYGPHPRLGYPAFFHPPPGYEELPCYAYVPNPAGSVASY